MNSVYTSCHLRKEKNLRFLVFFFFSFCTCSRHGAFGTLFECTTKQPVSTFSNHTIYYEYKPIGHTAESYLFHIYEGGLEISKDFI